MSGLLDKVAVVTGAARGMGRAHCEQFARAGADVIALDLGTARDELAETAALVEGCGRRCATAQSRQ
jgi:NAD(P)-dependent dehydrogenase (short-subunit alcohol dehydrogenase family)